MNIPLVCCYNFLISLDITDSTDSLRIFPLDFFPKLQTLKFRKCSNLEMISQEHLHDHRLASLLISECPKFVSFPKGGFYAPSMKNLDIWQLENLKSMPECMHTLFPSLTNLSIKHCPQLEPFSDGSLPSSLKSLKHLITSLKWGLGINTSLKFLDIGKIDVDDQGLLPLSLTSLHISDCVNLTNLDYEGLRHLSSLEELCLVNCPNLQCLPVEGLPKSISKLQVTDCLLLKQRCTKPNGEDWGKISHIQCVKIDCSNLDLNYLAYLDFHLEHYFSMYHGH